MTATLTALTTLPAKPLPLSTADRMLARGAERIADHAAGRHQGRPVLGCPRCG